MAIVGESLFGSTLRTRVLVLVGVLEETYGRQIAVLLGANLQSVQNVVRSLEAQGVLATRLEGRTRRISLDPRFAAAPELRALLVKLSALDPEYIQMAATLRRRPRRIGKPL